MPTSLGHLIKDLRESAGISSQRQLARKMDMTASYISRLEKNDREPSISFLRQFSEQTSIPFSVLLAKWLTCELDQLDEQEQQLFDDVIDQLVEISQLDRPVDETGD